VHIMHTGNAVGTKENITEEQIYSAINGLNEDFRKVAGTNGDGLGVDVAVEFCLAARTPEGEPTNGILRVDASSITNYAEQGIKSGNIGEGADEIELKSLSVWPREDYINIWVVSEIDDNEAGGGSQGYAYFPFDDVRDGIVILYNAFGTVGNLKTYTDLNRTITHEMGHSLGLYHTFYNTSNCLNETNCETQGDQICDTPPTTANALCSGSVSCPDAQVENYMDYTDENCRNTFTQGQAERMRTTLTTSRSSILEGLGCSPVAEIDLAAVSFKNPGISQCLPEVAPELEIQNLGSNTVNGYEILVTLDSNEPFRMHFDDTIASGESRIITLPTMSVPYGPHTLEAQISLDNGEADGWSTNDNVIHSFIVEESDFWTITVSPDVFGSETTWTLVDSLDTPIMFGGPYENSTAATYIQSGCVSVGCYELTIFDVAGDGMQYGGSYSLTSGNGDILAEGEDSYGVHFGFEEMSTVCASPIQFDGCEDLNANGMCDNAEIQGCQDSSACNFNPLANINDNSCTQPQSGYDCEGACIADNDGDGICNEDEITGCQVSTACNYNPEATDSGECVYAEPNYDCEGACIADNDEDGICNEDEITGCQVSTACNYNPEATDSGECVYAEPNYDCEGACIADNDEDGICNEDEITGCQVSTACNYNPEATDSGECVYAEPNYDCEGACIADNDGDGICNEDEITGCQVSTACNYNPEATDSGECVYAEPNYDCEGACIADNDGDGICDEDEITGCQESTACNYNPEATDSGECVYAEPNYDCEGNSTEISIEIVDSEVFTLYPNPYSNDNGKLFIRSSYTNSINLKIVGTDGRLVWEGEGTPYSDGIQIFIISESISPGTYIALLGSSNPFSATPLMIR